MFRANYRITYDEYDASGHLLGYGYILPTGERCEFAPGYNPAEDGYFKLVPETIQLAKELGIESNFDSKKYRFFSNKVAKIKNPTKRVEYRMFISTGTLDSFAGAYYWVNQALQ